MIFGTLPGGAPVELFELSSDKLTVRISNYGGRIISVVKDGMDMIVGPKPQTGRKTIPAIWKW